MPSDWKEKQQQLGVGWKIVRERELARDATNKFKSSVKRTPYDRLVRPRTIGIRCIGIDAIGFCQKRIHLCTMNQSIAVETCLQFRSALGAFARLLLVICCLRLTRVHSRRHRTGLLWPFIVAAFALSFALSGRVKIYALCADRFGQSSFYFSTPNFDWLSGDVEKRHQRTSVTNKTNHE